MRTPFPVPDKVVMDPDTGYALNIPAGYQEPYGWWNEGDLWTRYTAARHKAGVTIENDFIEEDTDDGWTVLGMEDEKS